MNWMPISYSSKIKYEMEVKMSDLIDDLWIKLKDHDDIDWTYFEIANTRTLPFVTKEVTDGPDTPLPQAMMTIDLSLGRSFTQRTLYRLPDFLADIGGFIVTVWLLENIFVRIWGYQVYENWLVSQLYKYKPSIRKLNSLASRESVKTGNDEYDGAPVKRKTARLDKNEISWFWTMMRIMFICCKKSCCPEG